jgi:hypothetical protein
MAGVVGGFFFSLFQMNFRIHTVRKKMLHCGSVNRTIIYT